MAVAHVESCHSLPPRSCLWRSPVPSGTVGVGAVWFRDTVMDDREVSKHVVTAQRAR